MKRVLIGLTGRKSSGKDTAAFSLVEHGFEQLRMAGALKDMLRSLLRYQGVDEPTIERMIEGDLKEVNSEFLGGRSARYAMQTLGTEWGRDMMNTDLWVNATFNRALLFSHVVISDIRFPNEVSALYSRGGELIRIERPNLVKNEFADHSSETLIDTLQATTTIINDGTISKLHAAVTSYVSSASWTGRLRHFWRRVRKTIRL